MIVSFFTGLFIILLVFFIVLQYGNKQEPTTVNQEPTVIDLTEFRESMKVKSPIRTKEDQDFMDRITKSTLDETGPMHSTGLDVAIDWKNPEPEDYEGIKFNPFVMDEIGPFSQLNTEFKIQNDLTHAERWKMGPIKTAPDWTEFKAQNPELFNPKKLEEEYLNKPFVGYKTILTGEVLNGTLFTEGPDGSVLQYTLLDEIPPNGRYSVYGTVENRNIIHITKYERHD